jgi:hypothetical protein
VILFRRVVETPILDEDLLYMAEVPPIAIFYLTPDPALVLLL